MWAKPKIYWKDDIDEATVVATSTASGYDVNNLFNRKEGDFWKATSTADQRINFDFGAANDKQVDYIVISGHNLGSIGATVKLQYSATGAWAGEEVDFLTNSPTTDAIILLTNPSLSAAKRYWSILITGTPSSAAEMAIAYFGQSVELDYVDVSFDPNRQKRRVDVSITQGGYVTGIHVRYTERMMALQWQPIEIAIHDKIEDLWENNGLKNFVIVWDGTDHAADIFLMRIDENADFNNPFVQGGLYRNVSLNLKGRKQ